MQANFISGKLQDKIRAVRCRLCSEKDKRSKGRVNHWVAKYFTSIDFMALYHKFVSSQFAGIHHSTTQTSHSFTEKLIVSLQSSGSSAYLGFVNAGHQC